MSVHEWMSRRSLNVILITIDTLRSDYLSSYNAAAPLTPNIDAIARNGVLFRNAYSVIPITLPSHMVMLTSRYPHELKLFNNGDVFDYKVPMLTDFLRQKRYQTAGFISLGVLGGTFGLGRGFEKYEDTMHNGRYYNLAAEVNALAIPWIEKNRKHKFFAWIHYSDPHEPYIRPDAPPDTEILIDGSPYGKLCLAKRETIVVEFEAKPGETRLVLRVIDLKSEARHFLEKDIFVMPAEGMEIQFGPEWYRGKAASMGEVKYFANEGSVLIYNKTADPKKVKVLLQGGVSGQDLEVIKHNYAAEVHYVDGEIGKLWGKLNELGLRDKTILILTSDHGEGLKTHGGLGHVKYLYQEVTHVPLIFSYPGLGRNDTKVDRFVNHLDIMPTILDLLHIENKGQMNGSSLKYDLTWSPIDRFRTKPVNRVRTFGSTYAPEAGVNTFSMIEQDLKFIHAPKKQKSPWEIYNLKDDPKEQKNLVVLDPRFFYSNACRKLRKRLEEFRQDAEASHARRKNPVLDPEQQKMLRALGYVAGDDD